MVKIKKLRIDLYKECLYLKHCTLLFVSNGLFPSKVLAWLQLAILAKKDTPFTYKFYQFSLFIIFLQIGTHSSKQIQNYSHGQKSSSFRTFRVSLFWAWLYLRKKKYFLYSWVGPYCLFLLFPSFLMWASQKWRGGTSTPLLPGQGLSQI